MMERHAERDEQDPSEDEDEEPEESFSTLETASGRAKMITWSPGRIGVSPRGVTTRSLRRIEPTREPFGIEISFTVRPATSELSPMRYSRASAPLSPIWETCSTRPRRM
jgi:hypothetical protein